MISTVCAAGGKNATEKSNLQAVFLDMDGTLVDTGDLWWEVDREIFAGLGHILDDSWRRAASASPMPSKFLIEATGAEISCAELSVLLNQGLEERIKHALPLMPGATQLLAELAEHQIPTALVSASSRRIIDHALASLGPQHFALSVAGDETPRNKPYPDPYLFAASRLGADPTRCAVVEDTLAGVTAAEAAGCHVVAVPSVEPIQSASRRTVMSSLEQVSVNFLRSLVSKQ